MGVGSEFIVKLPVTVLNDDNNLNRSDYEEISNEMVTRMEIEFSDIYLDF